MTPLQPHFSHPPYRPNIDGLRAIAVLSVVGFHAFPAWIKGGFIGVDIFFVISGFLISTTIFLNLETGQFSFFEFYSRRIRRLVPALSLVLIISYGLGLIVLYDDEYTLLAKHIAGGAGFISNLLLWRETGYFDAAAEAKPLLHLWSLGIEEQFYIFWPLLIWAGWKRKIDILALTSALLAASFVFNIIYLYIDSDPAATFYLPITRFWELLSGAILAWLLSQQQDVVQPFTRRHGSTVAIIGLVLLALSIVWMSKESVFPGFLAILPALGANLVILSGAGASPVSAVLSSRSLVWFGLISYPLYLWHWLLLSFAVIVAGDALTVEDRLLVIALAVVLAWLTYRFVERPVRSGRAGHWTAPLLAVLLISIGSAGARTFFGGSDNLDTKTEERLDQKVAITETDTNTAPSVMLVGDSHASHLFYGLNKELNGDVADFSAVGCIPFYHVDRYDSRGAPGSCSAAMNKALAHFENSKTMTTIVLSSMGPVYLSSQPFKGKDEARVIGLGVVLETDKGIKDRWLVYELGMRDTLSRLANTGKQVVFALDIPEPGLDHRDCLNLKKELNLFGRTFLVRGHRGECVVKREDYDSRTARYKGLIGRVLRDLPTVVLFDPTPLFCDDKFCHGTHDGKILYSDIDHLSETGSAFVAQHLAPYIRPPHRGSDD